MDRCFGSRNVEYETEAITAEHFGVQGAVKAIILPQSVKSISDNAFEGWGLESIVIPSSVKDLGWGLFDGCKPDMVVYCDEDSEIQKYIQEYQKYDEVLYLLTSAVVLLRHLHKFGL